MKNNHDTGAGIYIFRAHNGPKFSAPFRAKVDGHYLMGFDGGIACFKTVEDACRAAQATVTAIRDMVDKGEPA